MFYTPTGDISYDKVQEKRTSIEMYRYMSKDMIV